MFSSIRKSATKVPEGDGYDDEQHLVAAVSEFKKVESSTQTMVDQLYQRLASPFQITAKPCEANRAAVLQCYQQLQSADASTPSSSSATVGENSQSNTSAPIVVGGDAWLSVPYQNCYEAAMAYNQCVEKGALSEHLVLVGAFEQRGAQQQLVHKAAMEAQQNQRENAKNST
jgi:hypothetical protein